MKKTLLILVLVTIVTSAFGQAGSKLRRGMSVGDPDVADNIATIDSLVSEDGMVAAYSGGSKIGVYNDSIDLVNNRASVNASSISTNTTTIQTTVSNTSGVSGWAFSFSGDTMIAAYDGATKKFLTVESSTVDNTRPEISAAEVGNFADDTIIVTFNEDMHTDSVPTVSAFTITEDGVTFGIASAYFDNADSLYIVLDSAVASETAIIFNYTRPTGDNRKELQDDSNNTLLDVSNQVVANNVACQTISVEAHYLFENNADDETGNYDATAADGGTYTSNVGIVMHGTYSGYLDGSGRRFDIPSIAYGNKFTISGWMRAYSESGDVALWCALQSDDGFELVYDYTNDHMEFTTGNGATTTTASSSACSYSDGDPTHFAVVVDVAATTVEFYFNGASVGTGAVRSDFETTTTARLGIDYSDNKDSYGYCEDFQVYLGTATSDEISTLYNNIGSSTTLNNCGDGPTPNDSITIVFEDDFSTWAAQTGITEDTLIDHWGAMADIQSWPTDYTPTLEIRSIGGDQQLVSLYPAGQCCFGNCSSGDGGVGGHIELPIAERDEYYITGKLTIPGGTDFPESMRIQIGARNSIPNSTSNNDGGGGRLVMFGNEYNPVGTYSLAFYAFDCPVGAVDDVVRVISTGHTLSAGNTYEITMRFWAGTLNGTDAWIELFVDGVFVARTYDLNWKTNTIANCNNGITRYSAMSYTGGCGVQWDVATAQEVYIDDIKIYYYNAGLDIPYGSTKSGAGRIIALPD